jgi:hypothetical protein
MKNFLILLGIIPYAVLIIAVLVPFETIVFGITFLVCVISVFVMSLFYMINEKARDLLSFEYRNMYSEIIYTVIIFLLIFTAYSYRDNTFVESSTLQEVDASNVLFATGENNKYYVYSKINDVPYVLDVSETLFYKLQTPTCTEFLIVDTQLKTATNKLKFERTIKCKGDDNALGGS